MGSKASFVWQEKHLQAFKSLIEKLIIAPILAYPNPDDMFILYTDASDHSIGAVLSQVQDGIERL